MADLGVVIPAAGQGKRMGAGCNKQFLNLNEVPILVHTVRVFQADEDVLEIVIVGSAADLGEIRELVERYRLDKVHKICQGGALRQDSVRSGVLALSPAIRRVVVHDGARPLLTLQDFRHFLEASVGLPAAITGIPVKDTIKQVDADGDVRSTLPRELLRAVQTPQIFERTLLEDAHEKAAAAGYYGTDDASLLEWLGYSVRVLEGSQENIKVTTPDDLWLAERILSMREG